MKRYSSTISLTLTLDGVGWSTPRPGHLTLGEKIRFPLYKRLAGPQGASERFRKISPPRKFYPQTVQPVASPEFTTTTAGEM